MYQGFGPTLAAECLGREHGIEASKETVRQWMMRAELWRGKKAKVKQVHLWRLRRSRFGELVQWDSDHDWLEGRGEKLYLIAMIDGVTSLLFVLLVRRDSTEANMKLLWSYLALLLALILGFVFYAFALLMLVDARPFWLDEVIQFSGTCGTDWRGILRHAADNPGGAPLGYFAHQWLMSIMGCSILSARLPAMLASVGCLALLFLLGNRMALRGTRLGLAFWIISPLILRYSLEGRPYMQGMFFALLAVLLQIRLRDTRTIARAAALAACLSAAVYSQPYAVFAPAGFAVASVLQRRDAKYAKLTFSAYALAALSFLPWLLSVHGHWAGTISHNRADFHFSPSIFLLILREFVGDGYFAAVPILLLAAYSVWRSAADPSRESSLLLASAVVSSIALALFADRAFNYFFAMRQVIYMLPLAVLLAADGVMRLWARSSSLAIALVMVFAVASVTKDYRHMANQSENWQRLSSALVDTVEGGCVLLPDGESSALYEVFRPEIRQHLCGAGFVSRVVMPVHSYTNPDAARSAAEKLSAQGMISISTQRVGFATVETFITR